MLPALMIIVGFQMLIGFLGIDVASVPYEPVQRRLGLLRPKRNAAQCRSRTCSRIGTSHMLSRGKMGFHLDLESDYASGNLRHSRGWTAEGSPGRRIGAATVLWKAPVRKNPDFVRGLDFHDRSANALLHTAGRATRARSGEVRRIVRRVSVTARGYRATRFALAGNLPGTAEAGFLWDSSSGISFRLRGQSGGGVAERPGCSSSGRRAMTSSRWRWAWVTAAPIHLCTLRADGQPTRWRDSGGSPAAVYDMHMVDLVRTSSVERSNIPASAALFYRLSWLGRGDDTLAN